MSTAMNAHALCMVVDCFSYSSNQAECNSPSGDEAAPLLIHDEETKGFKPNFLRFVVSTSQSKPSSYFLGDIQGKSQEEKHRAAIHLYSGNSVYSQMNKALREDDMMGLKEFGSLVNLTMQPFSFSAMQAPCSVLKPFFGTVWRGCNLSKTDLKKYQVGEVVLWEGFSSTSCKPGSAFGGNVVFEIHCSKALMQLPKNEKQPQGTQQDLFVPAQIHHISAYPQESEVLYAPYTKFRIVGRYDQFSSTHVILETMEFPSLALLVKEGKWDEVKKGLEARHSTSSQTSPAWFSAHGSHLLSATSTKIIQEGAQSAGLEAISQLQAWWTKGLVILVFW